MRALIRFLARGAGGTVEQRDKTFEGDAITLGRATDQVLHLKDRRVELKHARIFRRGERLLISSSAIAGVSVNGVICRDAALAPGDVVTIGSNTLRLFPPPDGFDLAFTFELDSSARSTEAVRDSPVLKLSETRLAKRPWAWGLFALVAVACLIVPALGMKDGGIGRTLRSTALPDDGWWSSGPLSAAHENIGTKCESCHESPFVRVRSSACLECHGETLPRHAWSGREQLAHERCAACHLEHNEPASLVRRDPRLCAECHADLEGVLGGPHESAPVTDFAMAHPKFRLTMLLPTEWPQVTEERRVDRANAAGHEASGLTFPHDLHLDRRGIKAPTGDVVMTCADCHRPEERGARMQPINMEQHCASCHRLDFEPADPERTVPHGDPRAVLQTLVEYYSARYLEGYPDPHATAMPTRNAVRPGAELSAAQRAGALELARSKALSTARDLFERRTCNECHVVRAIAATDGAAGWTVAPTVLTRQWMPKAHFDHGRHSTALTACDTCHAASKSRQATDVLIPGIETCRECHGGARSDGVARNRVPSECTLCHSFHIPGNDLWVSKDVPLCDF